MLLLKNIKNCVDTTPTLDGSTNTQSQIFFYCENLKQYDNNNKSIIIACQCLLLSVTMSAMTFNTFRVAYNVTLNITRREKKRKKENKEKNKQNFLQIIQNTTQHAKHYVDIHFDARRLINWDIASLTCMKKTKKKSVKREKKHLLS